MFFQSNIFYFLALNYTNFFFSDILILFFT